MNTMPNSPVEMKWLTDVPSRGHSARWKLHKNLGHAKNALSFGYGRHPRQPMQLFEWQDDRWVLLYEWHYGDPEPWRPVA